VVQGQKVLPGVAYLELARSAVEHAAELSGETGMRLKNVVWARPIAVNGSAVHVDIALFPEDSGEISYEVYGRVEDSGDETLVHGQGVAELVGTGEAPTLDLATLRKECNRSTLTADRCYEAFQAMGIEYGGGHRGIEAVYSGEGQVLAKLSLPASILDTKDQYVLHPGMLDSALQASIGLMMSAGDQRLSGGMSSFKPALPFALDELEVFGRCTSSMWAFIRHSAGGKTGGVQKLDIDVCDESGKVCVRMKGFSTRVLEGEVDSRGSSAIGTLLLEPVWKEEGVAPEAVAPQYAKHVVMLCEPDGVSPESIESRINGVRCISLQSEPKGIEERFQAHAGRAFEEIQGILREKFSGEVLVQIVVPGEGEQRLFSGLTGLLKSAQLENPGIKGQLIEVEAGEDVAGIVEKLRENGRSPVDTHIRYRDGRRSVSGLIEVPSSPETVSIPWKEEGVYLITGGAGGLGLIFAREIAGKARGVRLILTGRSSLDEARRARIKEIESLGASVTYREVDVTGKESVSDLIESIREEFGDLNGIIHSAGVIRDSFIIKKSEEELQDVLSPKVRGLVNLDQASKELKLDFFILFSSMAGCVGNTGQADYSMANAFMDAYAAYRNALVASGQRRGQTLSVNWPLWRDGGMRVDEATERMLMQTTGMIAIGNETGIRALYRALATGKSRVMVIEGNLSRMKQKVFSMTTPAATEAKKTNAASDSLSGIDTGNLLDRVQAALKQTVSGLLKVRIEDIDADTELNEYGFDSITLTEFGNRLNQEYSLELIPTIFFEHPTLRGFAEYLVEEHQAALATKFGLLNGTRASEQPDIDIPGQSREYEAEEILSGKRRRSRFAGKFSLSKPAISAPEPIAIVGMSGMFPMAVDVNQFWRNLIEERDCITEIPKERWDWQEYYGDPAKEANKTNIKWGGFIDGIDEFDPLFFGISPREAESMDPQQRLLMLYAWKAIEDAGYSAQSLSGSRTAIFVGTGSSGYSWLLSRAKTAIDGYSSTGMVPSIGPNRMSYFLNINGPSEPIETACSSSLVAIHRAVNAIQDGTCEMAIVGGVNTMITPDAHISFNRAGMLCEDGHCKTFSDQANGYVRGEGVGMLFLKKLGAAERAGDHIYGVIRGSAENHGGRANSLTAPNPQAQAELLKTAYTRAGIDPRTVTYIEAHGTGTELGDPIEINGLKTAFKELYQATGEPKVSGVHCGLGSVKSNIGHLELAAGIAGVIKVILQLKHKTLIKSLHCETINPYIQLKDSPFYIVQETEKWKALQDAQGKELPRLAGVSSFGFGGTNAHVVIEEYKDQERSPIKITAQNPAIIVLSAKNEDRLKEYAKQLLAAIQENQFTESDLGDMAYTLQVGREAMEERLAVMVTSIRELEDKLTGFVEGRDGIEDLYRGQVKRNKDALGVFAADEELKEAVDKWIERKKYSKLLDLWVKGLVVDWKKIYGERRPRRISLPTYPFARERYWIAESSIVPVASGGTVRGEVLHPLLHENTSSLSEQRFSSTFTGEEFFLSDHVVKGQRVLPGVAYLELARTAVEHAAELNGETGIRLKSVVWVRPITVNGKAAHVDIVLFPEESGEISYEVCSRVEGNGDEPLVHGQGVVELVLAGEAPTLDLAALQKECNCSTLPADRCYEAFKTMGIEYGAGHRGIEAVYSGEGQVLAKLALPISISDTKDQYVLHPGLMDSALQASIGLMLSEGEILSGATLKPVLPFALDELEVYDRCTASMWAYIRHSNGGRSGGVQKLDIDVCDEHGKVCVRMKGFSSRVLEGDLQKGSASDNAYAESAAEAPVGNILLAPVWDAILLEKGQVFPAPSDRMVIIGGTEDNRNVIQ
jgi:polyketide synthase PksN